MERPLLRLAVESPEGGVAVEGVVCTAAARCSPASCAAELLLGPAEVVAEATAEAGADDAAVEAPAACTEP